MRKRVNSLDFLKFICALEIVLSHCESRYGNQFLLVAKSSLFSRDDVVDLFFIISGIMCALGMNKIKTARVTDYLGKKIIRLYPMAMLTVLLEYFVFCIVKLFKRVLIDSVGIWKLIRSLFICYTWGVTGEIRGNIINVYLWYIEVLLLCYIISFFLIKLSDKGIDIMISSVAMMLLGIHVICAEVALPLLNYYTGRGFLGFFLGMMLYFGYTKLLRSRIPTRLAVMAAMFLLVILGMDIAAPNYFFDNVFFIEEFVIYPCILCLCVYFDFLFKGDIWQKLGGISFEIYIWQSFAFCITTVLALYGYSVEFNVQNSLIFVGVLIIWAAFVYFTLEKYIMEKLHVFFGKNGKSHEA